MWCSLAFDKLDITRCGRHQADFHTHRHGYIDIWILNFVVDERIQLLPSSDEFAKSTCINLMII